VSIHPTAIVASSACIPQSCHVGPYCTIGPDVSLGEDCELVSHVVLDGKTSLGARNRVYSFACLGVAPQDLKYRGEPTALHMGDDNTIREYVTISRGTKGGGGTTRVGSHCLIMAYTHIGHDSTIGSHCILANGATLAGHVTVEDHASVGALCPVHQFCRIGQHAYVGGGTTITQDVLPFSLTSAKRDIHAYSLNRIGLQRSGFSEQQLGALQHAYRVLLAAKLNTSQALERLRGEGQLEACVAYLVAFIERSQRGVIK
jgi:UDP-N-acetylglucosamine acyltransferase